MPARQRPRPQYRPLAPPRRLLPEHPHWRRRASAWRRPRAASGTVAAGRARAGRPGRRRAWGQTAGPGPCRPPQSAPVARCTLARFRSALHVSWRRSSTGARRAWDTTAGPGPCHLLHGTSPDRCNLTQNGLAFAFAQGAILRGLHAMHLVVRALLVHHGVHACSCLARGSDTKDAAP